MKHAREDYDRIQDPRGLIPEDEPVFLLRGQDRAAPAAIEAWIQEAQAQGAEQDILQKAQDQITRMIAWQDEQPGVSKTPDL